MLKTLSSRSGYVWLCILLALSGCKEIQEAIEANKGDVTGSYELKYIKQDNGARCLVPGSTGCVVFGANPTDQAKVQAGSLFVRPEAPLFDLDANGQLNGTAKSYRYNGSYAQNGNGVVFHATNLVFIGAFDGTKTMTIPVPSTLFNPNATSSSEVQLIFEK